jgi:uncharacterized protein (TIGR02145 family)
LSTVQTATPQASTTVPSAPVISGASPGDGTITVTWSVVSTASSYTIYYQTGATVDTTISTSKTGVSPGYTIAGLTNGTQYAFAVIAVNTAGKSGLSNTKTATPQPPVVSDTMSDIDGNVYHTVTIGTQVWMAEDLKTSRLFDGTAITLVSDSATWGSSVAPGYCWYGNDSTHNGSIYGALYSWHTVNTGKLAPPGWHVPTDSEWTVLTTYLGGESVAGGKLKETGTVHWASPNTGATNETGMALLPGGSRNYIGGWNGITTSGDWWSSTADNITKAWYRVVNSSGADVVSASWYKYIGLYVRCVKN